jgi:FlaA1/EpsC-like NDP-sugar epimerase
MQPASTRRADSLLALPRSAKKALAVLADSALCVITVWLAICFRFESWVSLADYQWLAVFVSVALAIPLLTAFGFYHTVIRYVGRQTITAALRAIGIYAILYSAVFTVFGFPLVPRTIGILQPLLLLTGLALVRLIASDLLSEQTTHHTSSDTQVNVLIYGAGNSGQQLAASLKASGQTNIVGFLDDNTNLQKALIAGIPVFSPTDLDSIISKHSVRDVLLAMPSISRSQRNTVIHKLSSSAVAVRTLPRLSDLAQGHIDESDLRKLDIEDLLGRDPVPPDVTLLSKNITGKVVLITGAGGSIGSEIARQVLLQRPRQLVLFDVSEYAMYSLIEDLTTLKSDLQHNESVLHAVLGSVLDKQQVDAMFLKYRPDTVFHAAAYKHVPLVEDNIRAAIYNNIAGTLHVATAAQSNACAQFTLISTDKAVRPTNVMGATKRIAELCIHHIQTYPPVHNAQTQFSIVRFGNVLGSSGSVVPKFREQIAHGGPVTITHADITRYFMTIPEAAQLVIQAAAIPRDVGVCTYLLDMGEPVKIYDLARTMIKLAGFAVADEYNKAGIRIVFTGLRIGEKLYEELLVDGNSLKTAHPKIMLDAAPVLDNSDFSAVLSRLLSRGSDCSEQELISLLKQILPEFSHKRDN